MPQRLARAGLLACLAYFILAGGLLVPYAGLQADEALFAGAIWGQQGISDLVDVHSPVLKVKIPLMLMPYLGAFKAWIYAPLFKLVEPSALTVRVPALLAGALTLALFFQLLKRLAGVRAALLGTALLGSDPTFLLTTVFDWGPVVAQHTLLVATLWTSVAFYQQQREKSLLASTFCAGLALWDKALFFWDLSGIVTAALILFWPRIRLLASVRRVAIAVLGFVLGASPLLLYNLRHPWATLGAGHYSADGLAGKVSLMRSSLSGGALYGYLVRDDPEGALREPANTIERASLLLNGATASFRDSWFPWAFAAAVLSVPFLWREPERGPLLFAAIAFAVGWAQMLFTKDAGGSVHHTVLLWPFPQWMVALVWAGWARCGRLVSWTLAGALLAVLLTQVLVSNQYLAQFIRFGPGNAWTDAIGPLYQIVRDTPAREVVVSDWGILDPLHLLGKGRLPLREGSDPVSKDTLSAEDKQRFLARLAPDIVWVTHTDGHEEFPRVNTNFKALEAEFGLRRETVATVRDRNGRATFEVFRLHRPAPR